MRAQQLPAAHSVPDANIREHTAEATGSEGIGGLSALERRLSVVEASMIAFERIASGVPSDESTTAQRLLGFLAFKLSEAVDQPMLAPKGGRNDREGAAKLVFPGNIRAAVDCTLREFALVAKQLHATQASSLRFEPDFESTQQPSGASSLLSVHLSSYKEFCAALGVRSIEDIASTVCRAREDRRNEAGCLLRIIGGLWYCDGDTQQAMAIGVSHTASACSGCTDAIPVLYRASTAWEAVDRMYADTLETREMSASQLSASIRSTTEPATFCIAWKRIGRQVPSSTLWSSRGGGAVYGVLEARIPCTTIRGKAACTEAGALCSVDFIRNCLL
jgi:hypothetical protein